MSFFVFHVLDLKIVPIDSELNSAPGNIKIIFFKKKGVWYLEKQPNMKKGFEILKKRTLAPKGSRPTYGETKPFAYSRPQESWLQHRLRYFLIPTL